MQSVSSTSLWSLDAPPSLDVLLRCKIEDPKWDIEDALCTPDDQRIFLTASMTFLQNQLLQKLETRNRYHIRKNVPRKAYSDLLIIESKPKREKYFIRLKNTDHYDAVLKKEAAILPNRALSLDQILPAPKKSLQQSKSGIFQLLRIHSTTSFVNTPEKTRSSRFLNIFKKIQSKHKLERGELLIAKEDFKDKSVMDLLKLKQARCQMYVDLLPNPSSMISLKSNLEHNTSTTTLAINRLKMAPSFIKPCCSRSNTIMLPARTDSVATYRNIDHEAEDEERLSEKLNFLRFMSEQRGLALNRSRNVMPKMLKSERNNSGNRYYEKGYKALQFIEGTEVNRLTKSDARMDLKQHQQSKLSVCFDDETEYENEDYRRCMQMLKYSFGSTNFTDEVKSKFSSDYIPVVVKRM